MERACEFEPGLRLRRRCCFPASRFSVGPFRAKDVDLSAGWEFALNAA